MIKVGASLLAADFGRLSEEVIRMKDAGADTIHFDVMDGRFVPEISFGQVVLKDLSGLGIPFDVHLMTLDPLRQVSAFKKSGAASVTVHAETCDAAEAVEAIKGLSLKAGVAIKPATPIDALLPVLKTADRFLIMTVEPGYGGQKMIPEMLDKVKALAGLCADAGVSPEIEIDGGVNESTIKTAAAYGITAAVIGSALFASPAPDAFIRIVHMM